MRTLHQVTAIMPESFSRLGAVASKLRFPTPLIEPDMPISGIPALRLDSSHGTRRRAQMNPAPPQHPEFTKHRSIRETAGAARRHLMTPPQEVNHAPIDVLSVAWSTILWTPNWVK